MRSLGSQRAEALVPRLVHVREQGYNDRGEGVMWKLLAFIGSALLSGAVLTAHPGHDGAKLLVGDVARADTASLVVEYVDPAAFERKTTSLVIDERTKWTLAKKNVSRFELVRGQRVEVLMVTEDLPGGQLQTRALEIKVKKLAAAAR